MTGPSSTPPTVSNQQAWQSYLEYTGTPSKIARQAAFALGGAAWLLRSDDGQLTRLLVAALGLLIGFFALDIAHYAVGGELRRQWIGGLGARTRPWLARPRPDHGLGPVAACRGGPFAG